MSENLEPPRDQGNRQIPGVSLTPPPRTPRRSQRIANRNQANQNNRNQINNRNANNNPNMNDNREEDENRIQIQVNQHDINNLIEETTDEESDENELDDNNNQANDDQIEEIEEIEHNANYNRNQIQPNELDINPNEVNANQEHRQEREQNQQQNPIPNHFRIIIDTLTQQNRLLYEQLNAVQIRQDKLTQEIKDQQKEISERIDNDRAASLPGLSVDELLSLRNKEGTSIYNALSRPERPINENCQTQRYITKF